MVGAAPDGAASGLAERAHALAAQWIREGRRVDMQGLAGELGVSRVTLFRHAGGREAVLGAALWLLTRATLDAAERAWDRGPAEGWRSAGVIALFNARVSAAAGLRRLLDEEPTVTIRVLTHPRGPVQPGVVAAIAALLERDRDSGGLRLLVDPEDLAFALVRIGESFLYADVLANRTPDVETADRLQRALIEGWA